MDKSDNTIYLYIAGFNIGVFFEKTEWVLLKNKLRDEILYYCSGFRLNEKPDHFDYYIYIKHRKAVEILQRANLHKNFINIYEDSKDNKIVTFYQISIVQFILILRKVLLELLSKNKGFLLHSSAANMDSKSAIFLGKDRAGKSTIVSLLKKYYPPLADDISIIKRVDGVFCLYQTPFIEKEFLEKNSHKYSIGKIFFLRKAAYFAIEKITKKDYIFENLMNQIVSDKISLKIQIKNISDFVNKNDFYFLYFAKDIDKLMILFHYK